MGVTYTGTAVTYPSGARFIIQNGTGGTISTADYSVDYPRGLVTFVADTTGQTRYVTGYAYDMNAAAADVWTQKAAHYSVAYDVNTDNHGLKRSQIIANCMMLAKEFAAGAAVRSISVDRSDTGEVDDTEERMTRHSWAHN